MRAHDVRVIGEEEDVERHLKFIENHRECLGPESRSAPYDKLLNLLAVIHRDGGHYTEQHGLNKSCQDAEKIVANSHFDISAPSGQPLDRFMDNLVALKLARIACASGGNRDDVGDSIDRGLILLRLLNEGGFDLLPKAEPPTSSAPEEWKCAKCGWANAPQCIRCIKCLKYRDESSAPEVKASNSCNRHVDCEMAEKVWKSKHEQQFVPANFHCHDDCCEDCFGS